MSFFNNKQGVDDKALSNQIGNLTSFRPNDTSTSIINKILNEFYERGVSVKQFGAKCDANVKNSGNQKWYTDSTYTTLATDDTAAIQAAINAVPEGMTITIPGSCLITSQISITKPIRIRGWWGRNKSAGLSYGSRFVVADTVNQSALESVVVINSSNVEIEGIAFKGQGYTLGSTAILCKGSHGTNLKKIYAEGFNAGIKMGLNSAHVTTYDTVITACNDGVVLGYGNLFDFCFINCLFDGCIRSGAFLEANVSTENVTFIRTQFGWTSQYGILQDPTTTTGDAFSCLTLKDSPIEQVSIQPVSIVNGGNIRVEGGYWTWLQSWATSKSYSLGQLISSGGKVYKCTLAGTSGATAPTGTGTGISDGGCTWDYQYDQPTSAFAIKNVSVGAIWFSPKLETSYSNPSATSVISVTGYTNYNIYVDGSLNGFAPKWANYGLDNTPLPIRKLFVSGQQFAAQGTGVGDYHMTNANTDTTVLSMSPLTHGNYEAKVYVRVDTSCDVTVTLKFNNGNGYQSVPLLPTTTLAIGDYNYKFFAYMQTFNAAAVIVKASTANAVRVSASFVPQP